MNDFIAAQDQPVLQAAGLDSFEALWALQLPAVDLPNTERGGWSSVCRLEVDGRAYYLKRQSNHLTLSPARPFGEPTFARELRNIRRYAQLAVPALSAAFYAERKVGKEWRAILLTHALDGWQDLHDCLENRHQQSAAQNMAIVEACAALVAQLHAAGLYHACLYPKHIFLQPSGAAFKACFIDLEKTRKSVLRNRDRVRDIDTLLRRIGARWSDEQVSVFLTAYLAALGQSAQLARWQQALAKRRAHKERA